MEYAVSQILCPDTGELKEIDEYVGKELEVYEGRVQLVVEGTWAKDILEGPWKNMQKTGVEVTKGLHIQVSFERPVGQVITYEKPKCDLRTLLYDNPESIRKIYEMFEVESPEELMGKPVLIHLDDIICVGISKIE